MKENLYTPDCIRTFTGKYVNVFEPDPETICIEDIAHSLSFQCRFGGNLPVFYTVAEHCITCATLVSLEYKMQALLHDASEAYLLDIPRPIKIKLDNYKVIEENLMRTISKKFGFDYPLHNEVKKADITCMVREWDRIMIGNPKRYPKIMSHRKSEEKFLRFYKAIIDNLI